MPATKTAPIKAVPLGQSPIDLAIAELAAKAHPQAHQRARDAAETFDTSIELGQQPFQFEFFRLRDKLEAKRTLHHHAMRLEAAAGQQSPWPRTSDEEIASQIVETFITRFRWKGVEHLLSGVNELIRGDQEDLARVNAAIENHVASSTWAHSSYLNNASIKLAIEPRLANWRRVRDELPSKLAASIKAAVADQRGLVAAGFGEHLARKGMLPPVPPALTEAQAELNDRSAWIGQLSVPGLPTGPAVAELQAEVNAIRARIGQLQQAHATAVSTAVNEPIDRALEGKLDGWIAIAEAVAGQPRAFPAELGQKLLHAGADAIQPDALIWADVLSRTIYNGRGRSL